MLGTGTLVVSLDFELIWGVRDKPKVQNYLPNLQRARQAVPALLNLFERYQIHATWATVGLLFARNRQEQLDYWPDPPAPYSEARFHAENEAVASDESASPLHFALTLIEQIANSPGQEIASHTYTHYYCLERGQQLGHFQADLQAARAIAEARGFNVTSLVLPRNQVNPAYVDTMTQCGFECYRGNETNFGYSGSGYRQRLYRLLDSYWDLSGPNDIGWNELAEGNGLCNLRASRFLRPWSRYAVFNRLHLRRLERCLRTASQRGTIFHLWWHPHNFGQALDQNLARLESFFQLFDQLRRSGTMKSLTMKEVAAQLGATR